MAKIWFARRGPELWNKLEEMPAQSITGVAIKLAAMMHYDDELREAWSGKAPGGELGATNTFSGIGGFELGIERAVGSQPADTQSKPPEPQILKRRKRATLEKERGVLPTDYGRLRPVCCGYSEVEPGRPCTWCR